MAETDNNPPQPEKSKEEEEDGDGGLKYLNIVQSTASQGASLANKLYGVAKDNSGPLKTGIDTVETTVKSVISPVVDKYQDAPTNLLKAVDRKVDETVNKVQDSVPTALKDVTNQAIEAAQKAPAAALSTLSEVKNNLPTPLKDITSQAMEALQKGPAAALSILSDISKTGLVGTAKTLLDMSQSIFKNVFSTFGPMAKLLAVCAISHLNQLPILPQMAKAIGPAASLLSETYNRTVQEADDRGIGVASQLPLIPTETIANLFG